MISPPQTPHYYSPEEYLKFEVNSLDRHEYIDGEIRLMTGGTPNHNQIALNLAGSLNYTLKRQPYRVFVTDQRLWIPQKRINTYSDVMVVQQPLEFAPGKRDTITNPLMIAEILSKSTRNYDKDEKFAAYRTFPNFLEYLLIDQYKIHVEHYYKTAHNVWIFSEYENETDSLSLNAIPFQIILADIYDNVDFNNE